MQCIAGFVMMFCQLFGALDHSCFEFVSDFEFRASDFCPFQSHNRESPPKLVLAVTYGTLHQ
jgi:hypothetical protein